MESEKFDTDRRKEQRFDIYIDVKATICGTSFMAMVKNISGGGMEIQSSKSINPSSNLTLSLQLHEKYVFRGKVAWVLGDFIGKEWVYRAGIQTEEITLKNGKIVKGQEKMELVEKILPLIRAMGEDEIIMNLKAA